MCGAVRCQPPQETLTSGTGFQDPAEAVAQQLVLAEPPQHARRTVPRPAARPFHVSSGSLQSAEVAFVKAFKAEKRLNDRYLGTAEKMTRPQKPSQTASSTVLAIAGEDFSIVASDTRLSEGFSIHTRDSPKCYKLTDKTVIGCSGFHGDCLTLTKIIEARLKMYKHSNNKAMTTGAIAAMLSTILYSRRFFPYYVYNIIGGLDEEGKGAVYSFDPVGSYQRDSFKAGGSASAMLQPLLDNQVGFKNMQNVEHVPLSLDRAMKLVKDVFISAAERDVYTGQIFGLQLLAAMWCWDLNPGPLGEQS
ncbi:hypothetical protein STEG23_011461, partial [Scotinomys teguina]